MNEDERGRYRIIIADVREVFGRLQTKILHLKNRSFALTGIVLTFLSIFLMVYTL